MQAVLSETDDKRYLWILSMIFPILPLLSIHAHYVTQSDWAFWLAPLTIYTLIPLADWIIGEDTVNLTEQSAKQISDERYYKYLLYGFIVLQYLALFIGFAYYFHVEMSLFATLGWILTIGGIGGFGINTAHELGHKKGKLDQWMSKIGLAQTCYGYFFVEHNYGHHKNIATPEDPASSKFGESFYRFYPRVLIGSMISGWKIEKERLARQGKGVWCVDNNILQAETMSLALVVVLTIAFGWLAIPLFFAQALYGGSLLEVVNYLEHYGLLRQKDENGKYERVKPEHSWNSNHLVSNLFLFHLQRHSDHHANPTREYQSLRHFEGAPQLPNGYAGMVALAYFPWLWRKVMDKRVLEHYGGDMSKINH